MSDILSIAKQQILEPAGLDEQGTPFGIQVIGPMHADHRLLGIAAALEQAFAGDQVLRRPVPDLDALASASSACRTDGRSVQLDS